MQEDTGDLLFSIVVPTWERPRQLEGCLQAIAHLDYPQDRFEVLVVDDGTRADLGTIVDSFRHLFHVRLLRQDHSGPAAARNLGGSAARGRWLAFIDDDCRPAPDWLGCLQARLEANTAALVGGRTLNSLPGNLFAAAQQSLLDYLYSRHVAEDGQHAFFPSNNVALPTTGFETSGGFDTSFRFAAGEDRELCDRWRWLGRELVFAPEAVAYHGHDLTLAGFCRMHFHYGCGSRRFHYLRAARNGNRMHLEPPRFYLRLITYPFAEDRVLRAAGLSGLLLLSQVAHAAGYVVEGFSGQPDASAE